MEKLKEQRKAALKQAEKTDSVLKEQFEERYYRDGDKVRWERFGGNVDDEDDEKMLLADANVEAEQVDEVKTVSALSAGEFQPFISSSFFLLSIAHEYCKKDASWTPGGRCYTIQFFVTV